MGLFSSNNPKEMKHSGILGAFSVDTIKWEPDSTNEIAHRFEYEDFPNGSYLHVADSQMAVFTNNLTAGNSMNSDQLGQSQVSVFTGPCKIKLETGDSRFAPFRNISHSLTGGESAFHSTVYFINNTYINDLAWGTQSPFLIVDPLEEVNVHVRAQGFYGVHLEQLDTSVAQVQVREFLKKVVGTQKDFSREDLNRFLRQQILSNVPTIVHKKMTADRISVLEITSYLEELSSAVYEKMVDVFLSFGLVLDSFSFTSISVPEEDIEAINQEKIKAKQAQFQAKQMDIESEALARKRAREGYTYQQEHAFDVLGAAASNEGTASTLMGAGMGLGMGFGVGGAFGNGMGQLTQGAMGNLNMMGQPNMSVQPQQESKDLRQNKIICKACNAVNDSNAKFCSECGEKIEQISLFCPECGSPVAQGSKFCSACDCKINSVKVCPNCQKELESNAKFCPECGTKMI